MTVHPRQDPGRTTIRPARAADVPHLPEIERAAGELFRGIGMDAVADDELPPIPLLEGYVARGAAWVAAGADDAPVGYLLVDDVDGATHIEQVSVHPSGPVAASGGR